MPSQKSVYLSRMHKYKMHHPSFPVLQFSNIFNIQFRNEIHSHELVCFFNDIWRHHVYKSYTYCEEIKCLWAQEMCFKWSIFRVCKIDVQQDLITLQRQYS